jgi:RimJ/RimL family protein N-acetyltransferase
VPTPDTYLPMAFSLETDRLSLRLRGPEDAPCNLELRAEQDEDRPRSLAEEQRYLANQRAHAHETGFGFLSIQRRMEGDRIGYCGILIGRGSFDEPELAYELLRRAHGQGYATEAAQAVMDAIFATGRRRLWATVRTWNSASFRVLDKLGFHRDHVVSDERGELVYLVRDAGDAARDGQESGDGGAG